MVVLLFSLSPLVEARDMAQPSPKGIALMGSGEGYFRQIGCRRKGMRKTTVKKTQILEGIFSVTEAAAKSRFVKLVYALRLLCAQSDHASSLQSRS